MPFTNDDILQVALRQSAVDAHCSAQDFLRPENVIVPSAPSPAARKYLELPFLCDLISYGSNIVASVSEKYRRIMEEYIAGCSPEHCFETPHLLKLDEKMRRAGARVCFMAEYFLPDVRRLQPLECPYTLKWLGPPDFAALYLPQWGNALCAKRRELDVLGLGAYANGQLIGLAACSADCETMWQIGIDVLPAYRRQGVARALTAGLALEVLRRGKVPFYCAAWANIRSVRNAVSSGLRPAWAELTVKSAAFTAELEGALLR